jgi:hypothetical protein
VKAGRLNFTTDLHGAVAEADAVFIAVGTPSRRGDDHADLSYVHAVARSPLQLPPNDAADHVAGRTAYLLLASSAWLPSSVLARRSSLTASFHI